MGKKFTKPLRESKFYSYKEFNSVYLSVIYEKYGTKEIDYKTVRQRIQAGKMEVGKALTTPKQRRRDLALERTLKKEQAYQEAMKGYGGLAVTEATFTKRIAAGESVDTAILKGRAHDEALGIRPNKRRTDLELMYNAILKQAKDPVTFDTFKDRVKKRGMTPAFALVAIPDKKEIAKIDRALVRYTNRLENIKQDKMYKPNQVKRAKLDSRLAYLFPPTATGLAGSFVPSIR